MSPAAADPAAGTPSVAPGDLLADAPAATELAAAQTSAESSGGVGSDDAEPLRALSLPDGGDGPEPAHVLADEGEGGALPLAAAEAASHAASAAARRSGGSQLPLISVLLVAAAGAGIWLLRRLRAGSGAAAQAASVPPRRKPKQQQKQKQDVPAAPLPEPVDPDGLSVLVCGAPEGLPGPGPAAVAGLPLPLAGLRLCLSEDVSVAGTDSTLGLPQAGLGGPVATTAAPVVRLLSAGAVLIGKASMQPFGLDLVGANVGNPYNRANIAGGGHTGECNWASSGAGGDWLGGGVRQGSAVVPGAVQSVCTGQGWSGAACRCCPNCACPCPCPCRRSCVHEWRALLRGAAVCRACQRGGGGALAFPAMAWCLVV